MSKTANSVYSKYLTNLNEFETEINDDALNMIDNWKKEVRDTLEGAHKIRFSRLTFYKITTSDFDDEIPF